MTQELLLVDSRPNWEPEEVIKWAVKKYKIKKLVGMYSGGKDSLLTATLTFKAIQELKQEGIEVDFECIHCVTGTGSAENFEFVLKSCQERGWKVHIEYPNGNIEYPQEEILAIVKEMGFNGPDLHAINMRRLKIQSIERWLAEEIGLETVGSISQETVQKIIAAGVWFVSGKAPTNSIRRKRQLEAALRKGKTIEDLLASVDDGIPGIKPMFFKTKAWTWRKIREMKLNIVASYEKVHHSLECLCPSFVTKSEMEMLRIFYKDLWTDMMILSDQYGGKHWVTDEKGRRYLKDFGRYGEPPKHKKLKKEQQQLMECSKSLEDLACFECGIHN